MNGDDAGRVTPSPVAGRDPALLFSDLAAAGRELAGRLACFKRDPNGIVLALVRGGVPVALEVARHLELPMDLILLRRLFAPRGPEWPVCAVRVAGSLLEDEELAPWRAGADTGVQAFLEDALGGLARREQICRRDRPPAELEGKTVLLVDNGVRSGRTLRIALRALRRKNPSRIIVAAPVAAPESASVVEAAADEFITLGWRERFGHVGLWYREYRIPEVEEIGELLARLPKGEIRDSAGER